MRTYNNRTAGTTTGTATTSTPRRRGFFGGGRRTHHTTTAPATTGTTTTGRRGYRHRTRGYNARSGGGAYNEPVVDSRAGVGTNHVGGMHVGTHAGTTAPVHHHKRHVSMGDRISGAMLKLRGTLTGRPGVKAAGTRRMHGTDGRGSRRMDVY